MGWILLAILTILGFVGLTILKAKHENKLQRLRVNGKTKDFTPDEIEDVLKGEQFPVPKWIGQSLIGLAGIFILAGSFQNVFFYALPGYVYHIRTAFNQERIIFPAVDGLGWSYYGFGTIVPWKQGMTIQAASNTGASTADQIDESGNDDTTSVSANLLPQNIVFLDQVDGDASATARFRIPTDKVGFFKLAREYRTPANFLNTALVPAFKETLQATASLMSAEEYFSGARTEFNTEFQAQLEKGIYIVKREEVLVDDLSQRNKGSANATKGTNQEQFGDGKKVVFKVQKQYMDDGLTYKRKIQNYVAFGVSVVDARVTEMIPNDKFKERMDDKQKASASRAIARETRVQEEEQKLLAVAKGEREVAERQAKALVEQIEQTTNAETEKQLALTSATKLLEQADIDKQTSAIRLDQAKIDAERIQTLADANAYEREKLLESDNGLQMKVDAIVQMNRDTMKAYALRNVPTQVIYSGNGEGGGLGSDGEVANIAKTQLIKNLNALDLDLGVKKQ